MQRAVFLVAVLLVGQALADCYCQSGFRCSNNRLNEASANRNNANRLFDSQNNNRGGVNVGVRTNTDGSTTFAGPDTVYNAADLTTAAQYQLLFYETSLVNIEWTAQHGCGGNEESDPHQLNCNMVLQYMCDTNDAVETDRGMAVDLRDGTNTGTPGEPGSYADTATEADNINQGRGHHESEAYYYECKTRKRNRGLFLADQNLNGDTARFTRQNPNGGRSGLECPEERDYFPYFHATPWKDIAYLTDDVAGKCDSNYIALNSQNTVDKYKCVGQNPAAPTQQQLEANNPTACAAASGTWKSWRWNLPAPVCQLGDWSRVNHLGNGRNGQMLSFNMTLGSFAAMRDAGAANYLQTFGSQNNLLKCVFRMRYNISTDDYDPWNTNSSSNDNANAGIVSPVRNNPTIDVGADLQGLKLAINTNQFGRTFQDRSHIFYVKTKPSTNSGSFNGISKIVNLGVRGKRGNIVQTYPSIEYDFNPNRLHIPASEIGSTMLHIQWTGSNTHNNGDPGGDGQTGDAGQGTGGTDRHNMVQMLNADENYPLPLDNYPANMWSASTCYQVSTTNNVDEQTAMNWIDCALMAATSGQIRRRQDASDNFDPLLNTAPASLIGGFLMKFQTPGDYFYMCTRNNSFSNRSQKGVIIVGNPA